MSGGGSGALAHQATTARAKFVCTCVVIESYMRSKLRENIAMSMLSSSRHMSTHSGSSANRVLS